MRRIYESAAYDPAWPDSHWRKGKAIRPRPAPSAALSVDVAVIGAGYAGLNAALALARDHGLSVAVFDAAEPGWGASGRNGGFCCFGGAKLTDRQIVARVGADGARAWRGWQRAAVDHVAGLLDRHAIDARQGPEGDAYLAHSPAAFAAIRADAEAALALHGKAPEIVPPEAMAERGLSGPGFHGAEIGCDGFPIDPLAYHQGLLAATEAAGAQVFGQSPVGALAPAPGGGWRLRLPAAEVTARQVLVATNGYGSEDIPGWIGGRTLPVVSSILVTRPLTAEERAAQGFTTPLMSYDSRQLLHYFRHLPDGRFMFGMRGGTSASPAATAETLARVRRHFEALFPAWAAAETESRWSGLACLTGSLAPYVGPVPGAEGVFAAFGWHGNGVAPASYGGLTAARLMAGAAAHRPDLIARPPNRFPFPAFRRTGLRAAYAAFQFRDGPLPG